LYCFRISRTASRPSNGPARSDHEPARNVTSVAGYPPARQPIVDDCCGSRFAFDVPAQETYSKKVLAVIRYICRPRRHTPAVSSPTWKLSGVLGSLLRVFTAHWPRVRAVYLTSVNALFLANVALNKINRLLVISKGQNSDSPASTINSSILWL